MMSLLASKAIIGRECFPGHLIGLRDFGDDP